MRRIAALVGLALLTAPPAALAAEAFVTNQGSNELSIIDLDTMASVATIPIPGGPAGIAVSGDGKWAYVTSPDAKQLTVVDAEQRTVVRQIPVGGGPLAWRCIRPAAKCMSPTGTRAASS